MISNIIYPVSCLLPPVSCLLSPVSCLLSWPGCSLPSLRRRPVSSEVAKERWGAEGVELTLTTLKQFLTSSSEDQGLVRWALDTF